MRRACSLCEGQPEPRTATAQPARSDSPQSLQQPIAEHPQIRVVEVLFDIGEQPTLLEVHVGGQSLSERLHSPQGHISRKSLHLAANAQVVNKHSEDHGVARVAVRRGVERKQNLLLDAEVKPLLQLPDGEERRDGLLDGLGRRSPQAQRDRERVLVIS